MNDLEDVTTKVDRINRYIVECKYGFIWWKDYVLFELIDT